MSNGFAMGGAAKGMQAGFNIMQNQQQLDMQNAQLQQQKQQQLLEEGRKMVDDAVKQAENTMKIAHQKAATAETPEAAAEILDNAKKGVDVIEATIAPVYTKLGQDPTLLKTRFSNLREMPSIQQQQKLKAQEAGAKAGAEAAAKQPYQEGKPYMAISKTDPNVRVPVTYKQGQYTDQQGNLIDSTQYNITTVPSVQASTVEEATGLTKPVTTEVQKRLLDIDNQISDMERTKASFKPEYLELPTKVWAATLSGAAKLGLDLSPEQQKLVGEIGNFKQNAITTVNNTIRAITGAQMNQAEIPRIESQVPNLKDDKATFMSKLDNLLNITKIAKARYQYLLKNGFTEDKISEQMSEGGQPAINIDDMEKILDNRVNELRTLNKSNEEIRSILKQEFGI